MPKQKKKVFWRCITAFSLPRENVMHFWPLDEPESVFWVCLPHEKIFHQLLMVFVCPLHVEVRQEFNQGPVRVTFHMVLVGQHPTNLKVECKEKIRLQNSKQSIFWLLYRTSKRNDIYVVDLIPVKRSFFHPPGAILRCHPHQRPWWISSWLRPLWSSQWLSESSLPWKTKLSTWWTHCQRSGLATKAFFFCFAFPQLT